jgi:hypothetical protein
VVEVPRVKPVGLHGDNKIELEVNVAKPLQKGQRRVKEIKVEGVSIEEKEVIVRHEISSVKWKRWNYGEFSRKWNKAYLIDESERILK